MRERLVEIIEPYRCVVFDFDGTLIDLQVNWLDLKRELSTTFPPVDFVAGGMKRGLNSLDKEQLRRAFEIIGARELNAAATPRSGMADLVQSAHASGKTLGLVSANTSLAVRHHLSRVGLLDLFTSLVGGEMVVKRKPDPEGLLRVIGECGYSPEEVIYIADGEREGQMADSVGVQCHLV